MQDHIKVRRLIWRDLGHVRCPVIVHVARELQYYRICFICEIYKQVKCLERLSKSNWDLFETSSLAQGRSEEPLVGTLMEADLVGEFYCTRKPNLKGSGSSAWGAGRDIKTKESTKLGRVHQNNQFRGLAPGDLARI
jgi:hypothetical protein